MRILCELGTPSFKVDLSRTSATSLPSNSHSARSHTNLTLSPLLPGIASLQHIKHFKVLPPSCGIHANLGGLSFHLPPKSLRPLKLYY